MIHGNEMSFCLELGEMNSIGRMKKYLSYK